MTMPRSARSTWYPKPGPMGGVLIREVIAFLRDRGCQLPITSHILIAFSGGADSLALAHLILHFGRRIINQKQCTLLHVNHGWRGAESDDDELFVKNLASQWGVSLVIRKLVPPTSDAKNSWEELARTARQEIFEEEAQKLNAMVFTAHHADDLAETVLWRICTGAASTHAGGIAFQYGIQMRPFLKIRKKLIRRYLEEIQIQPREDSTNDSNRFLRARMRKRLMPELEKIFPKSIHHLVSLALEVQQVVSLALEEQKGVPCQEKMVDLPSHLDDHLLVERLDCLPYEILFQAAGLKARRSHLEYISGKRSIPGKWKGELHLPKGWKLTCEKQKFLKNESLSLDARNQKIFNEPSERWILEKV